MYVCSEKVLISQDKPFIYLEGLGIKDTVIFNSDAVNTADSASFTSMADNFVAIKNLT